MSKGAFIQSMGHFEAKFNINNAPDLMDPNYDLAMKITFATSEVLDVGRTKAMIEVTRPKSNTDIKLLLK